MAGVIDNHPGFPYTPPGVDILEGGKLTSNNVAGSSHNPLQSFVVASGAVSKPGGDAAGQDALHSAGVEWSENAGAHSKLPQPSQEEEALMWLIQHCICVSGPCEILGDVNAEELKAVYPLHRCLVNGDGCVFSALSLEIHHQLLGLVDVEWEVVLLTPFSQGTHLRSVGCLIVVSDRAYHHCVISEFDDDVGAVCGCTVMCVQGVQEWLRTQPCGDEVLLPILTTWLLPVRKSRIQLHRDLFSPRVWSFATTVAGTMVLNAEM